MSSLERILGRLDGVRRSGEGWLARCPGHEDRHPSLGINEGDDGRVLLRCFAGCAAGQVVVAGLGMRDLFPEEEGGRPIPRCDASTVQQSPGGCTLERYAQAKQLPAGFLQGLGSSDITRLSQPALRVPYLDAEGNETAVWVRVALTKDPGGADNRFRWRKGSKLCLYGLDRLKQAREAGYVILVEGESDCHTLWHHGHPALGLPGANTWQEARDALHLDGIDAIYVLVEPDTGEEATPRWLSGSAIRDRVLLMRLDGVKDTSELHLADPGRFAERLGKALRSATPWTQHQQILQQSEHATSWEQCRDLAETPDILAVFVADLRRCLVVGEDRLAQVLFLAIMSRLLDRPVSVAVKGPSSAGKSFTVKKVVKFLPEGACYPLTAMSERALAYSEEPLNHRMLVLYEAAGLDSDFATYLIRSLLSEGRIRYETVLKTSQGLEGKLIEREGPTGLITTTTAVRLHPENATRLFSITTTDTNEQTRAIMLASTQEQTEPASLERWHALHRWIETGDREVAVPYAPTLAELIPPVSVRLRRDFPALVTLIKAHALLHAATRQHDSAGRVLATHDDYQAVRGLVSDLVSDAAEATVRDTVRETIAEKLDKTPARQPRHTETGKEETRS